VQNVNLQINDDKKKVKKIVLASVLIPIMVPIGIIFFILLRLGAIQYPKWYITANFYLNKNHFERLVDSDFEHCSNFSYEIESYISNTDDEKLQKSMRVLFKGIWGGMTKNNHQHIYFFEPFNFIDSKARGILYYEGEDDLNYCFGDLDYVYRCKPIGNGWYYYEADYKLEG